MSKRTRRKAPNPGPTAEVKKDQQLISRLLKYFPILSTKQRV